MPTKAADFFNLIVRPTVREFLDDTGDLRRGFLAAIVLYHAADYWDLENNPTKTSLSELHQSLIKRCPDFRIIRDVADASKHGELRKQKDIPRILSSSDKVKPEQVLRTDGINVFSPTIVMYTRVDGTTGPLAGPVQSVLSMWETMLQIK
jgi:hypothetical protein